MKTQILSKSLLILLIFGSFFSCRQKPEDTSIVRSHKYRKCIKDAYTQVSLSSQMNMIPGTAVAVTIDNQLVWADGLGYSNYELKARTSPRHKFRIGQVSELITALTTAKLNEAGKIQIDKPLTEYFTGITKKPIDFTIRQLGAHAAGIRMENARAGRGNTNNRDTAVCSFIQEELAYQPGTAFSHTELGFDLIGYLIEKSNKEPFTKVVQKTLLDTLNLTQTIPDVPFRIIPERSSNYDYDFISLPTVSTPIDLRGKEASAGYLSSVLDLAKMGNLLLYPGFLKPESIDLLTKPYKLNDGQIAQYSFGIIVSKDLKGRTFYGLRGNVSGGCAALLIFPEDKLVIAAAANIGNINSDLPVFEIAEAFMKQLHPELYKDQEKEPAQQETAPETK